MIVADPPSDRSLIEAIIYNDKYVLCESRDADVYMTNFGWARRVESVIVGYKLKDEHGGGA